MREGCSKAVCVQEGRCVWPACRPPLHRLLVEQGDSPLGTAAKPTFEDGCTVKSLSQAEGLSH